MALPATVTITFSDVGPGLYGDFVLTYDESDGYYQFYDEYEGSTLYNIILGLSGDYTILTAVFSFSPFDDEWFYGIAEGEWATEFTNTSEDPPGTGTAIVIGFAPSKATTPAPAHQATKVSKSLTELTWVVPE